MHKQPGELKENHCLSDVQESTDIRFMKMGEKIQNFKPKFNKEKH